MKARKTKQFPLFGGNILDECPDCGSVIVSIGFDRGICPSCARLEILSLRKQVKRLTKRAPDRAKRPQKAESLAYYRVPKNKTRVDPPCG